jgi:hypothetical protein
MVADEEMEDDEAVEEKDEDEEEDQDEDDGKQPRTLGVRGCLLAAIMILEFRYQTDTYL